MESARTYTSVSVRDYRASGNIMAFPGFPDNTRNTLRKPDVSKTKGDRNDPGTATDTRNAKSDFDSIYEKMRAASSSSSLEDRLQRDAMNRIRIECIQFLLYMLFGTKGHPEDPVTAGAGNQTVSQITESYQYYHSETEETCFNTTGKVITEDGRELEFDLELTMSRSFTEYYEENVTKLTTFTDPLVINLDVPNATVSDVKISFDLDCDGSAESISALDSQSGYLALDLNDDGIINDGSELFGTSSGNGFADLAKYDSDKNGWIDEADEIFDRLIIACIKEDGTQELIKLKDRDIGAIYTGSAATQFSLTNPATNEERARIRQTGIFLYENGTMGTIQQLDLAR